jgi:hypothetical protein
MPNPTQRELLDSFIAEEGIYFTTIQEDEVFNLGTKILYLERAISQNCQDFLQSLDKLYAPDLGGEAKTANIEFIRALKLINDCCFNNQVKYGQYGTRATLTHFFGSLGEIDPGDFQTTVQTIINQQIAALREGHLEEVTSQKTARETAETDIARQTGWRAELDLPVTQLPQQVPHFQPIQLQHVGVDVIQVLNGALTGEQYQQLSAEVRQVVAGNADATRQLIQGYGATFATIQALAAQELRELFNRSHEVARLVNEVHIPLADLLALDQAVRTELLYRSYAVARLVNGGAVSFEQLSGLSVPQLRIVIANPESGASQEILNPPSSGYRPDMF